MLIEQIRTDLVTATKAKDTVAQRTLRSVIAAVQEAEVSGDEAVKLDDAGVQAVVKAQVKRRMDAAEAFTSGGATERADAERAEMAILEGYLPAALGQDELDAIVSSVFAEHGFASPSDMGAAMKAVNAEVAGRADGRTVADLVKSRLA
ncbi:MAG: GatB/YqeY domain-containing protein [Ilumatobacter sp.]|uniref:GatB/YqeY domain-containing protein n=1 Tax=Ilumatobacter sp. TaxID=1967498 RepID=UPI0032971710